MRKRGTSANVGDDRFQPVAVVCAGLTNRISLITRTPHCGALKPSPDQILSTSFWHAACRLHFACAERPFSWNVPLAIGRCVSVVDRSVVPSSVNESEDLITARLPASAFQVRYWR